VGWIAKREGFMIQVIGQVYWWFTISIVLGWTMIYTVGKQNEAMKQLGFVFLVVGALAMLVGRLSVILVW
jgi:hypothetical protein